MKKSISELDFIKTTKHGRFKTDPVYCKNNGINRRSYCRKVAKALNQKSIGEWYDCNKSVKENLEWAQQNGIKVCRSTLKTFCIENGINPYPYKTDIGQWYNPELSVSENFKKAKDDGIKVSRSSLYNYVRKQSKDNDSNKSCSSLYIK